MHYTSCQNLSFKDKAIKVDTPNKVLSLLDVKSLEFVYKYRGKKCTFELFGKEYFTQEHYLCKTCSPSGEEGDLLITTTNQNIKQKAVCCLYCSKTCHRGHNLQPQKLDEQSHCNCGANRYQLRLYKK